MSLLVVFFAKLFASSLSRHSFLHAALFARFQIIRMPLYILNNVFRLNFALESTQGVFQRFTLLNSYFCQAGTPNDF